MRQVVDKAIILKRIDYAESDRIITLLTEQNGKITVLAKGIRKTRSKLAGSLELFSTIAITFIDGKSDLKTIMSARLIRHNATIAKHLDRSMFMYDVLKLVDKATESECDGEYYRMIDQLMVSLDDNAIDLDISKTWFYARLLSILGYQINLDTDSNGQPFAQDGVYSFAQDELSFVPDSNGFFRSAHIKLLKLMTLHQPQKLLQVKDVVLFSGQLQPVLEVSTKVHIL